MDCDGSEDVPNGNADCGVFGGWPYLSYQYVMRAGGKHTLKASFSFFRISFLFTSLVFLLHRLVIEKEVDWCAAGLQSEEDYPYCVGTGACYPCQAKGYNKTLCGPPVEYCNATAYPCRQVRGLQFLFSFFPPPFSSFLLLFLLSHMNANRVSRMHQKLSRRSMTGSLSRKLDGWSISWYFAVYLPSGINISFIIYLMSFYVCLFLVFWTLCQTLNVFCSAKTKTRSLPSS